MRSPRHYRVLSAQVRPRNLDPALGFLYYWGLASVEQRRGRDWVSLSAEIPHGFKASLLLQRIRNQKPSFFRGAKVLKVQEGTWARNYLRYLKPFPIVSSQGSKLWIDPRGDQPKRRKSDTLFIDPSLAFGTGTHPTTQLTAELLDKTLSHKKGARVLDLGCGTGILAMLAQKMGAAKVCAVDNDPIALQTALENFARNRIKGIRLAGSLKKIPKKFDIIVANILFSTLLELKTEMIKHLAPKGALILSGLVYKDVKPLLKFYGELRLKERRNRKGWTALALSK